MLHDQRAAKRRLHDKEPSQCNQRALRQITFLSAAPFAHRTPRTLARGSGNSLMPTTPRTTDCMGPAQHRRSFAPKSYRRYTLGTSSIRRLLTWQCAAVTLCWAVQLIAHPRTMKSATSSQTKGRLKRRFYEVFTGSDEAWWKNCRVNPFCARLLHSTDHRRQGFTTSGKALQTHNNSGRVAPRRFQGVHMGGGSLLPFSGSESTALAVNLNAGDGSIATWVKQFATGS